MELELKLPQLLAFTNNFSSDMPHLTFHVITQLYQFYLEKLELFMLVHVRLHGLRHFLNNSFNIGSMEEYFLSRKLFH